MFQKISQKIKKWKFIKKLKKERKSIFIETHEKSKSFKKRKKYNINLPKFENIFSKKNLRYLYISISFIVVISLIILIFSPILNIKKINIETNLEWKNLVDINILYSATDKFRNKNILFINEENIKELLMNYEKNIKEVTIDKWIFTNSLDIKVVSFDWIYYSNISWRNYIISSNWVLIPANNNKIVWLKEIRLKKNLDRNAIFDYKKIFDEKYLTKIDIITKKLEQNILWIKVINIYYFEKERELHLNTQNNTKLIFDINWDVEWQIKKIAIFNKENSNIAKTEGIIYIDLRIKNKIFYCTKEEEYNCNNNLKILYWY